MLGIRKKHLLWVPLCGAMSGSYYAALWLRYDFVLPRAQFDLWEGLLLFAAVQLPLFWMFQLHENSWRFVGLFDLCRIAAASTVATACVAVANRFGIGPDFPGSMLVLDGALAILLIGGVQFAPRLMKEGRRPGPRVPSAKSILIYGAGEAGMQLGKEVRSQPRWGATVAGFLDDDESKRDSTLIGLPVLGCGRDAAAIVARKARRGKPIAEIVIAMPSATGRQMRTAIANCRAAGVPVRTLPSIGELLEGKVIRQIRDVSPEDLLGREPVRIEEGKIGEVLEGRVVMVTGGCGSIGSEICRQVARFSPRKLVILDQAESESFMLALNLRNWSPQVDVVTEIGDITVAPRVEETIARHGVDVVFHAAAYKHVPLMEQHVIEAVYNNVIGTYNVALAAHRHGVERFVLISSDKAVNPTSVMGLTKRAAELLISAMPLDGGVAGTRFVSVRFGNVLGSSGSVVQIFRRQIAAGGPVTITDPRMQRYFMSISEAVQLVLQASTMGTGSEVFVLDMGEPVLIRDLAYNMIRLAGLEPGEDIEVRVTGLRPGEKLFEEIHLDDENHLPTHHEKVARFASRTLSPVYMSRWLEQLQVLTRRRDADAVLDHLKVIVPEYQGTRRSKATTEGNVVVASAPVA